MRGLSRAFFERADRLRLWTAFGSMVAVAACSGAGQPGTAAAGPAVESDRLEALVYDFAADSMMGREAGTIGHDRATRYLADRARAFGLEPAGVDGTFFQEVPLVLRSMYSSLTTTSGAIEVGYDFAPLVLEDLDSPSSLDFTGIPVVFGGDMAAPTEISADEAAGKIVVLGAARGPEGRAFGLVGTTIQKLAGAEAILMASIDYASSDIIDFLLEPQTVLDDQDSVEGAGGEGPFLAFVSEGLVERLFGSGVDGLAPGTEGPPIRGEVGPRELPVEVPTRNVIALVPGSDPEVSDEHVVISAHSDHTGLSLPPVDHDSLRAYLTVVRPGGAEDPERDPTPAEQERISEILAETGTSARLDSINNGADDDASGSMALLEIGRVLMASPERPRRSVLLVWHTAEEGGLLGARYFTNNPTVPLESMVADINIDMIGRGTAEDVEGLGGPSYLQLIGSRRLSTELGDLVETVNREEEHGFRFDYTFDADGHPANFYCRSDHYMYARYGIPIVFMTTGGHRDYHMPTDEPQYIDYMKMGRVTAFVRNVAERVANLDHRLVVDGPIPDPDEPCQQ